MVSKMNFLGVGGGQVESSDKTRKQRVRKKAGAIRILASTTTPKHNSKRPAASECEPFLLREGKSHFENGRKGGTVGRRRVPSIPHPVAAFPSSGFVDITGQRRVGLVLLRLQEPAATSVQRPSRDKERALPPPPPLQNAKPFPPKPEKWERVGGLTQKVTGGRKDATDDRDQRVQRRVTLGKLVDGRGRAAEVGAGAKLFLRRAEAHR